MVRLVLDQSITRNAEPWCERCVVAFPCAIQNDGKSDVINLVSSGFRILVKGKPSSQSIMRMQWNGRFTGSTIPYTPQAVDVQGKNNIFVASSKRNTLVIMQVTRSVFSIKCAHFFSWQFYIFGLFTRMFYSPCSCIIPRF